jgi:drug/metabolite transporter (DMT)-like permease
MEQRTPLVIRSFLGLITYTSLLVGVMLLPIFIANIILNTAPFWTSLLAYCFLGEPVKNMEVICMVGCFVGVVTIATSELIPHKAAPTLVVKNTTAGTL